MDIKNVVIAFCGFAAGAVTWSLIFKKKWEAQYIAEIADSKAVYESRLYELESEKEKGLNGPKMGLKRPNNEPVVTDISSIKSKKAEDGYDRDKIIESMNYASMYVEKEDNVVKGNRSSEIISDDEYYSNDEYTKKIFTYHSESKDFTDESGRYVEYADAMEGIGNEDYLGEFGGFETDVLFVRNFDEGVDYQIILEENSLDGEE